MLIYNVRYPVNQVFEYTTHPRLVRKRLYGLTLYWNDHLKTFTKGTEKKGNRTHKLQYVVDRYNIPFFIFITEYYYPFPMSLHNKIYNLVYPGLLGNNDKLIQLFRLSLRYDSIYPKKYIIKLGSSKPSKSEFYGE